MVLATYCTFIKPPSQPKHLLHALRRRRWRRNGADGFVYSHYPRADHFISVLVGVLSSETQSQNYDIYGL